MELKDNKQDTAHSKGWVTSSPINKYSTLHELSLPGFMGWDLQLPKLNFKVEFSLNMHTPLEFHPQAYLIFHTLDAEKPPAAPQCCYSITEFQRWRLNISPYKSFEEYCAAMKRWHHTNYLKSEKIFKDYGCEVSFVESNWSHLVEEVYALYKNVAKRHGDQLYDLNFFQTAAKRDDYRLICAWFEGKMIGMFLLVEEVPTLHSICCGLDYNHSSESCAYSWLHYALIEHAINAKKYINVDVGLTADDSKRRIGFEAIPARMDIYSRGIISRNVLRAVSKLFSAKINSEGKLKFGFSPHS